MEDQTNYGSLIILATLFVAGGVYTLKEKYFPSVVATNVPLKDKKGASNKAQLSVAKSIKSKAKRTTVAQPKTQVPKVTVFAPVKENTDGSSELNIKPAQVYAKVELAEETPLDAFVGLGSKIKKSQAVPVVDVSPAQKSPKSPKKPTFEPVELSNKVEEQPSETADDQSGWSKVSAKKSKLVTKNGGAEINEKDIAASPVDETISIDCDDFIKYVIGPKGENINKIKEVSGAKLNTENGSRFLKISGSAEEKAIAFTMVRAQLDDLIAKRNDLATITINLKSSVGTVIGKGGENIKAITNEFPAVKININREKQELTITGPSAEANGAADAVHKILAGPPPPESVVVISYNSINQFYAVFGEKGSTIKQLQESHNTKVDIERQPQQITISGDSNAVSDTVASIQAILKKHDYIKTVSMLPNEFASFIAGKGIMLKSLQDEFTVIANFQPTTQTSDKFILAITGDRTNVDRAAEKVELILITPPEALIPAGQVMHEIPCEGGTSQIIGSGGNNLKNLMSDFNVKIDIIKCNNMCRIIGHQENVKSATRSIETLLKNISLVRTKADEIGMKFAAPSAHSSTPNPAGTHTESAPYQW